MFKTLLIALTCSAATATTMLLFVGRTVHSSPFQMDIPYGTALKVTTDPANVWSWHHTFTGTSTGVPVTADVLVDFDGDTVMDTQHSWVRVLVTDIEIVGGMNNQALAWILDGTGKRLAVGIGGHQSSGPVHHVSLTTPIVLSVGSPLRVQLVQYSGGEYEVHLIGRVVSL
jgi:hypothetical protein